MKYLQASLLFVVFIACPLTARPVPCTWQQVKQRAEYIRADSSPNAAVSFAGRVWILAGWTQTDKGWQSQASVWTSVDCSTWSRVNAAPPYDPYSAFVVFKGSIWAVAKNVYRSTDGKDWTLVAADTSIPVSSRISVFKNQLWVSAGRAIWRSSDGTKWELVTESALWGDRQWPVWQSFNGYLWLIGGGENYNTASEKYFNDTWRSTDGRNWERVKQAAPWMARYWNASVVHEGKLWMLGGWIPNFREDPVHEYGNLSDAWFSTNGLDWEQAEASRSWPPRHAPYIWTHNRQLYVAGGYGGGGYARLYNDVWCLVVPPKTRGQRR